jgi:hypothetical protein
MLISTDGTGGFTQITNTESSTQYIVTADNWDPTLIPSLQNDYKRPNAVWAVVAADGTGNSCRLVDLKYGMQLCDLAPRGGNQVPKMLPLGDISSDGLGKWRKVVPQPPTVGIYRLQNVSSENWLYAPDASSVWVGNPTPPAHSGRSRGRIRLTSPSRACRSRPPARPLPGRSTGAPYRATLISQASRTMLWYPGSGTH